EEEQAGRLRSQLLRKSRRDACAPSSCGRAGGTPALPAPDEEQAGRLRSQLLTKSRRDACAPSARDRGHSLGAQASRLLFIPSREAGRVRSQPRARAVCPHRPGLLSPAVTSQSRSAISPAARFGSATPAMAALSVHNDRGG